MGFYQDHTLDESLITIGYLELKESYRSLDEIPAQLNLDYSSTAGTEDHNRIIKGRHNDLWICLGLIKPLAKASKEKN